MTSAPARRARKSPPLKEFLHEEALAGLVLLAAAIAAMIWANSPAGDGYATFWHHPLTLGRNSWAVTLDLQHWINDGLMVIFFFVVGLEIKRELTVGALSSRSAALLPAIAAAGGVTVPALLYLAIAPAGPAREGWGIPMATDIAFAVGVLALLGAGVSAGTKLLLLSIAIVDDILAITVIAVFYSDHIEAVWLLVAAGCLVVVAAMGRRVASPWAYLLPALVTWFAVLESGVHATIAGVALGLLTPAHPVRGRPVLRPLEHLLHPVAAFVVVPLFALANAGVDLRGGALGNALDSRLTWAVLIGLVLGKTVGIAGATLTARRAGVGTLPAGMPKQQVLPVAMLGGIGFTMAIFIADLAFDDPVMVDQAKVGVLAASLIAAIGGALLLAARGRRR